MAYRPEIQLQMFNWEENSSADKPCVMKLLRPHRWANKVLGEVSLAEVRVESHKDGWMWGIWLDSRNGAAQGYRPARKWGRMVASRELAIEHAVDEVRIAMIRATDDEAEKIGMWCGQLLSGIYL